MNAGNRIPNAGELIERIAAEAGAEAREVERTLAAANITLETPSVADRRMQVLRLRVRGVKPSGEAFAIERDLGPGVWAIVHRDNNVGKTSMLEFLVWPLRGEPRDLPPEVKSWVRYLSADVLVSGRAARIILESPESGSRTSLKGRILASDAVKDLLAADDGDLRLVAEASGEDDVARCIGSFYLDAFRMGRTSVWHSAGSGDGEGGAQVHGWPAYFGACYLNPGGEKILLGDVGAVGLPGHVLKLFVDLPYSTTHSQLSVAEKSENKTLMQGRRRAEGDAAARQDERVSWQTQLDKIHAEIGQTRSAMQQDVGPLFQAADKARESLRQQMALLDQVDAEIADVALARIRAEQALIDAEETWQARRVLGRLNPVLCPRCEEPLGSTRHTDEREHGSCAVCARPLPEMDPDIAEAVLADLRERTEDARAVEARVTSQRTDAAERVEAARTEHQRAADALEVALTTSQSYGRLRDLELSAATLEGRLSATGPTAPDAPPVSPASRILDAAKKVVDAVVKENADATFPALDREIVELAQRFGVKGLDSVRLDRQGKVNAVKSGKKVSFASLSRGDRLRMRVATVIALLRVGARSGASTHPGVLLIDSIAAEEVTEVPIRVMISELQAIAEELPGLQVVFTTVLVDLASAVPKEHVITSEGENLF
jgi:hypothetical protein